MTDVDHDPPRSLRRSFVQSVIQLANKHLGGACSLISVDEGDWKTTLTFALDTPIRSYPTPDGKTRQSGRIIVTVEVPERFVRTT